MKKLTLLAAALVATTQISAMSTPAEAYVTTRDVIAINEMAVAGDIEALRAYVHANPHLLSATSPIAQLLRQILESGNATAVRQALASLRASLETPAAKISRGLEESLTQSIY